MHNLQNVDLDIPRDALVVFTGLSGSGKSSLAFDTIFAEGQRRYVESLSAYARQFLGQVDRPDVDFIEGLSPAVSIDQKSTNRNPRSTVGTITEIYDYMRLLWARIGVAHCPICGETIQRQTVQQIADQLMELDAGIRYQVVSPVVSQKKGEFVDLFKELAASGYSRAIVDGETIQLNEPPLLKKQVKHDISVVIDRLVAGPEILGRLTDSLETALRLTDGLVSINYVDATGPDAWQNFSEKLSCPNNHPIQLTEIEPRTFSFNAPFGACPECSGLGTRMSVDEDLLLGDHELSIAEGVILPWTSQGKSLYNYYEKLLEGLSRDLDFSLKTPWSDLPANARNAVLRGENFEVRVKWRNRYGREMSYTSGFEGVVPYIERQYLQAETDVQRARWSEYLREVPCPVCDGKRLKPEVLSRAHPRSEHRRRGRAQPHRRSRIHGQDGAHRPRADHRRAGAARDQGAPRLPHQGRAHLPEPVARCSDAVGRRGPAHPSGHPDRIRPHRRALRARRAEHRPAPARQPAPDRDADRPARPGQHAHRRRARRGHHPHRRLDRRHRPRRRRQRRQGRALGLLRRPARQPPLAHRRLPVAPQGDHHAARRGARSTRSA